jgi:hypothetical protein
MEVKRFVALDQSGCLTYRSLVHRFPLDRSVDISQKVVVRSTLEVHSFRLSFSSAKDIPLLT